MRIAIIASARFPIVEPFEGGLEKQTHDLAVGLLDRGHDVTVFAADGSDPRVNPEIICGEGCQIDFSDPDLRDNGAAPVPFMRAHHAYLHLMLELRERDFDIVQNSSLHYLPVSLAPLLDVPFVTTLHSPPTVWLASAIRSRRDASRVTFVSVSEANARTWLDLVDVRAVIPNGIDLSRWRYSSDADPEVVVWSGRFVPEKGPHLAVEAAHMAGRRVLLAGPIEDRPYAEKVLARLRNGDEYLGHLDQDDLAAVIGTAGTFVSSPCWEEPFGLVVVEALACGTPVASFDRGAMAEVLHSGCGVLAPSGDVEALADGIRVAVTLERETCRKVAEEEYSVDTMVDRYEDLYRALAA